jgi:hypothetical protein
MEETVTSRFRELGAIVQHSLFDSIAYRRGIIECSERHIVYVKWTVVFTTILIAKALDTQITLLKGSCIDADRTPPLTASR